MNKRKVIISGGGTGGHLYSALELGRKMKELDPFISITYMGSQRGIEKKIMKKHDAHFISLNIQGIKGKGIRKMKSLFILPVSFFQALFILFKIKPDLAVGLGGYSSGPILILASILRIPTLIIEQNRFPGFTNRVLLPWVDKVAVSFKRSLSYFKEKGIYTGNPVRKVFYSLPPKKRNEKLTVLIFGGSQGSHFLNKNIIKSIPLLTKAKEKLKIFHQTGEQDFEWVKNNYVQNQFENVTVAPYFDNMAHYFKQSDLIISRAGATTIAELIASRKASLLVPFAKASDNHQLFNAKELEKRKGAEILTENNFTPDTFAGKINDFINNKNKITDMEKNLAKLNIEKAADKISELCFSLMKSRSEEHKSW